MLLKSFNIKNFRSILRTGDINFSKTLTTIIGKNNQGKSNILKALKLVFDSISFFVEKNMIGRRHLFLRRNFSNYRWSDDFPVKRQNKNKYKKNTEIMIELVLDEDENVQMSKIIKKRIKGNILKIELILGQNDNEKLNFIFKGVQKNVFNEETITKICSLIYSKISFQYIQAIRTDKLADEIANTIISLELSQLAPQKRDKLDSALKDISDLQKPILQKIEKNILKTLQEFIPEIENVSLDEQHNDYFMPRRYIDDSDFHIKIDDGSNTILAQKGDGIKSLVALGMMRQKGKSNIGKGLILAIEEPESHLHPEAIRQISRVINDISKKNQVILTSHSPLFVNRDNIKDNIIVEKNKAYSPTNMKEIREVLGVIASDNLINSEFAIVVEGETDKKILQKYFIEKSKVLKELFENKRLCFEVINGVNNLSTSLNKLSNMSTKFFCILDSDQPAINRVKIAKSKALLSPELKEVSYYTLSNLNECELEDLINPQIYGNYILKTFNIDIFNKENKDFINGKDKWSSRIEKLLRKNGKLVGIDKEERKKEFEKILNPVKEYISNLPEKYDGNIDKLLTRDKTSSIFKMVNQLENYFTNK